MSDRERSAGGEQAFVSDGNMSYVEGLYEDYLLNPTSVSEEWRVFFQQQGSIHDVSHQAIRDYFLEQAKHPLSRALSDGHQNKQAHMMNLVNAFRQHGHLAAQLDPLDMMERPLVPDLNLAYHQLSEADLNDVVPSDLQALSGESRFSDLIHALKATYCGSIGIEYMHIAHDQETLWFQKRLESVRGRPTFSTEKKREILQELIAADGLERYLGTRYVGQKRFSLEGGDALIPMMKELIRRGCQEQVKEVVIGMAHRGRLNVLINVLGKSPLDLFQEFEGKVVVDRTGDVKYHLGFSSDLAPEGQDLIHLSLAFNPSHLEIIGPVVQGSARSRLHHRHDLVDKNTVLPLVIHGDAAFAGQGVVMETFNFSQARGYCTGGTVHIVINNQIGFTTSNPLDARSTLYCTDVAKMAQAPVIHVNGDDPEAVVFATQLALDYRMTFKRDVVLDLVCYRRQGHNEADEPMVTQPRMYQKIKSMPVLREKYARLLIEQGVVTQNDVDTMIHVYRDKLDQGHAIITTVPDKYAQKRAADWAPYLHGEWMDPADTRVSLETLQILSDQLLKIPENFVLHPVVKKIMHDRELMTRGEMPMNWGYAETMAFASLLHEGYEVRLSGQDCGRGTFAHRHAEWHDQATGERYVPLETIAHDPAQSFAVIDSVLSEEAVLAFEYGYSSCEPTSLVLWEAQFGDFANGAQMVVDQFISSGEQKWGRLCGLVMLLPHGYEGQGPEHSSARLERFMQLCAEENIQVCNLTTPAQIFHVLRRQMIRKFRKPLIIMTPKSLLRHKLAISTLDDLTHGAFASVLAEADDLPAAEVKRVVLCSGKVYYDLLQKRRDAGQTDVAIIRVEQLYPFPTDMVTHELKKYANATQVVWCQEEPQNQGCWFSLQHEIHACLGSHQSLRYAGRGFAAAPAVGSYALHASQQEALVKDALG